MVCHTIGRRRAPCDAISPLSRGTEGDQRARGGATDFDRLPADLDLGTRKRRGRLRDKTGSRTKWVFVVFWVRGFLGSGLLVSRDGKPSFNAKRHVSKESADSTKLRATALGTKSIKKPSNRENEKHRQTKQPRERLNPRNGIGSVSEALPSPSSPSLLFRGCGASRRGAPDQPNKLTHELT